MTLEKLYKLYLEHPIVTTDSRVCAEGSLFFALKGDSFDGNKFAASALDKGCSYAIVDRAEYATDDRFIVVDDVLDTLQQLARYHREMLRIPIIGITGTNGKTTTKELVATILKRKYKVHYTQGNFNNHIGVPLTILQLNADHEIGVIEMGANHPGEIAALTAISQPNFGLITNVGKAHLEGFGSFEGVKKTKGELYNFIIANKGKIFINENNEHLKKLLGNYPAIGYALNNPEAEVNGNIVANDPYITLHWRYGGESHGVKTHFIGEYNGENMLAAVAIGHTFGVEPTEIESALADYVPQNNRSQMTKTEHNQVVVDAYNANPTSMSAALDNFKKMTVKNKYVILGDMLELGAQSKEEHAQIVKLLKQMPDVEVILVGKEFEEVAEQFTHFHDVEELIGYLKSHSLEGKNILLKGSHGIALEKALPYL